MEPVIAWDNIVLNGVRDALIELIPLQGVKLFSRELVKDFGLSHLADGLQVAIAVSNDVGRFRLRDPFQVVQRGVIEVRIREYGIFWKPYSEG